MWVEKHTRRMISYTYCKDLRETQILLYALKKYGFCLNQSLDIRQELGLALILVKISTYFEQKSEQYGHFFDPILISGQL